MARSGRPTAVVAVAGLVPVAELLRSRNACWPTRSQPEPNPNATRALPGILGWQYIFTPQGLDALTTQWMRLYCPQRLMLDLQNVQPASHPLPPPPSSSQAPEPPKAR